MKTLFMLGFLPIFNAGLFELDTIQIQSQVLERKIEVYILDHNIPTQNNSIIYFTDGKKLVENGMLRHLQELQSHKKILPSVYVFVSTIDPDNPDKDFRNEYFFCNSNYVRFFEEELIPKIEARFNNKFQKENRLLVGLSFGGLNAAYFAAKSKAFQNYALLSPITYPCKSVKQDIVFSENKNLNIFLSTGKLDAEKYLLPLQKLFESKEFNVKTLFTEGNHDFENWISQIEEMINFFIH